MPVTFSVPPSVTLSAVMALFTVGLTGVSIQRTIGLLSQRVDVDVVPLW